MLESFLEAKRKSKHTVYLAKFAAEKEEFATVSKCHCDEFFLLSSRHPMFWMAKQMELIQFELDFGREPEVSRKILYRALSKVNCGKVAGPSGIVAVMLQAAGDLGVEMKQLTETVFQNGVLSGDWEASFILTLHILTLQKGKEDALSRGKYRGLKFADHVVKLADRVLDPIVRKMVRKDQMQYGFVPGSGTTDAIFTVRQLQIKNIAPSTPLWGSAFVQGMFYKAQSRARVNGQFSEKFEVKVGVHRALFSVHFCSSSSQSSLSD